MSDQADRLAIRDLVENWAVWRDAGDWERFRGVWHDDGRMMATWFQGSADEFIRVSREGWNRGVSILHFLGGSSIDVDGDRATAQTKMTISQRGDVHGGRRPRNVEKMPPVRQKRRPPMPAFLLARVERCRRRDGTACGSDA